MGELFKDTCGIINVRNVQNNISVCTSIDGPCELQNKNRPYKDNDSYKATINSFKKLKDRDVTISALLTTTMPAMKDTVKAIIDAGLQSQVKIMVGGAPITQEFADEIGADAYTQDAASAAQIAKTLV